MPSPQLPAATQDALARIHDIAPTDVGRGIGPLAARAGPRTLTRAAQLLAAPGRVAIVTGFFIPRAHWPAAETDGPLGAVQLAAALEALGVQVDLVTDVPCGPVVTAARDAAGIAAPVLAAPLGVSYPRWQAAQVADWSDPEAPLTTVVFVERPGPAACGRPRNMLGTDIGAHTAPLHQLTTAGAWATVAVGDGGNEVGMGSFDPLLLAASVARGATIHCVVPTDATIAAGVSNWGAAALVAALSCVTGRMDLAAALDQERAAVVLEAMLSVGAVDGVSAEPVPMVDGLPWEASAAVLRALQDVAVTYSASSVAAAQ